MKKGILKATILGFMAMCCSAAFIACGDDDDDYKKCNDERPYYCSSAKSCCKYRYNDGHGSCWETMEGCRSSGYACETCHIYD
jgi:hypothetical protein